ncbi:MAG: Hsp70 family protein, partial [Polyangiaceae bacterium]|nr:Hsp70 family protein [Polyangiaceae bacterium]
MTVHLGIDFGTTRSVVAVCDRGNYPVVSFLGEHGDPLDSYPSIVAETRGSLLYGLDAARAARASEATFVRSFKRLLSDPLVRPDQQVQVGQLRVGLLALLTGFLEALRRDL